MRHEQIKDLLDVKVGDYLLVKIPFEVYNLGVVSSGSLHKISSIFSCYSTSISITIEGSSSPLCLTINDRYGEFVRVTEDHVLVDYTEYEDFIEL